MPASNIMHGARAKVWINNEIVGIFSNVSFGLNYDVQPAFILGKFAAASLDYVAQDVVQITASGWKAMGVGWHKAAKMPRLQELLTADYIKFLVEDRVGQKRAAEITHVRPTSASGGFGAKQLSESTFTFMGIYISDDDETENTDDAGAVGNPFGGA